MTKISRNQLLKEIKNLKNEDLQKEITRRKKEENKKVQNFKLPKKLEQEFKNFIKDSKRTICLKEYYDFPANLSFKIMMHSLFEDYLLGFTINPEIKFYKNSKSYKFFEGVINDNIICVEDVLQGLPKLKNPYNKIIQEVENKMDMFCKEIREIAKEQNITKDEIDTWIDGWIRENRN